MVSSFNFIHQCPFKWCWVPLLVHFLIFVLSFNFSRYLVLLLLYIFYIRRGFPLERKVITGEARTERQRPFRMKDGAVSKTVSFLHSGRKFVVTLLCRHGCNVIPFIIFFTGIFIISFRESRIKSLIAYYAVTLQIWIHITNAKRNIKY